MENLTTPTILVQEKASFAENINEISNSNVSASYHETIYYDKFIDAFTHKIQIHSTLNENK